MGRQINFYLHPDDLDDFEEILKSQSEVEFLPYYHYDNIVSTVPNTIPIDIRKEGTRIYVVRKNDLKQIKLVNIEKFGYWLVDDNHLPVLHYDRSIFDGNKILRGRLYFQPQYVKDLQMVDKSEEFVKWADNIIKTARKKLKKYKFDMGGWGFSEYVGSNTKAWLEQNKQERGKIDPDLVST